MTCACGRGQFEKEVLHSTSVDLTLMADIFERYRYKAGSLITVLQETQGLYGYLPMSALKAIARELNLKPARVYGVATFYTQFRFKPVGKHLILLCQGTACHVNGAERILTRLSEDLKIQVGETTSDGLFTLETVACLGCCSLAPVMTVDGQAYGPLTPEKASRVLKEIYDNAAKASEGGGLS